LQHAEQANVLADLTEQRGDEMTLMFNEPEQRVLRFLKEEFLAKGSKPQTMWDPVTPHRDLMEKFDLDLRQYREIVARLEYHGIVRAIAIERSYGHLQIDPGIVDIVRQLDELSQQTNGAEEQTERVENAAAAEQSSAASEDAVWLGNRTIRIGDEIFSLEVQFAEVLEALVELGAATKPQLQKKSGKDDPDRLLRRLVKRFPRLQSYITFPGRRGKGGYRTTIKDGRKAK
jgi:hypothetical protein